MPPQFADDLEGEKTISVLPLTNPDAKGMNDGWCTYAYAIGGCPELEVFCGGINDKTPKAAAIWRQGNLLHFGFEPHPEQLNDDGKHLLVNSIAYIARFTEDRPILRTPSPFQSDVRYVDRRVLGRIIARGESNLNQLKYYTEEQTFRSLREMEYPQVKQWLAKNEPFLTPDEKAGKLKVDTLAMELGESPQSPRFFERCIESLAGDSAQRERARTLLDRYVPDGPESRDDGVAWRQWYDANADYLFFSDAGGYRWYLDRLAQKRNTPSADLRGVQRASLPEFRFVND